MALDPFQLTELSVRYEDSVTRNMECEITLPFRRLQTVPCSLYTHLKYPSLRPVFDYAAKEMRNLRFWGSRFLQYHLVRLLEEERPLPVWETKASFLPFLKSVAEGARPPKDEELSISLARWKAELDIANVPAASIRGLNTISTKTCEEYFVSFEKYHLYGLQQHWARVVAKQYALSRKRARMVIRRVFEEKNLGCFEPFGRLEECTHEEERSGLEEIARTEGNRFQHLETLTGRLSAHYEVAKLLEQKENPVRIAMAPLCNAHIAFVTVCKQGLGDLFAWVKSKHSDRVLGLDAKSGIAVEGCLSNEKTIPIESIFSLPRRSNWTMSPTFRTDGYALHLIWQRDASVRRAVSRSAFEKHQAREERKESKWREECEAASRGGRVPDQRKRLALTKQACVQPTEDCKLSRNVEAFRDGQPQMYHREVLEETKSPVYALDPGMRNLFHGVKHQSNVRVNLTSQSFYNAIRVPCKRDDALTEKLSKITVRMTRASECIAAQRELRASPMFKTWGNEKDRSRRMLRNRRKQQFYDQVASRYFPEEDAIVCVGNGHIETTLKGLATCPIAKIMRAISRRRRVVFVPEAYTSQKCSECQSSDCVTMKVPAIHKGLQTSSNGRVFFPTIHGLRQCPHCARTWNRDHNAARNILNNALSWMKSKTCVSYLSKTTSLERPRRRSRAVIRLFKRHQSNLHGRTGIIDSNTLEIGVSHS